MMIPCISTIGIKPIWICFVGIFILNTCDAVNLTVSIDDCTPQTLAANLQFANSTGQHVQTLEGDARIDIYQQMNGPPTWLYYQMNINVSNGTTQQHPMTNFVTMDFNVVSGNTTHCKRYIFYYPTTYPSYPGLQ